MLFSALLLIMFLTFEIRRDGRRLPTTINTTTAKKTKCSKRTAPLFPQPPHDCSSTVTPSFVSETFFERIGLVPKDVLGKPLVSIVDPRDEASLKTALTQVLNTRDPKRQEGDSGGSNGTLVNLRMSCGGVSYEASMTITIGTEGLVVVTRLY